MIALALTVGSCAENSQEKTISQEQLDRLSKLSDSIGYSSPNYIQACDSMLKEVKDSIDFYEIFINKGMRYTVANPADSMLYYAEKTLAWTRSFKGKRDRLNGVESRCYSLKATYYHQMRQNNDSSIIYFGKAYDSAMKSDIINLTPDIAANLGDAYIFDDDLPNAAHWYRRALFIADSLNLPERSVVSIYMGLGRIYTQLQDYPTAQKYYEDADARFNMMKPNMQIYFLNNYGNFYYFRQDYKSAQQMFLRMMKHIEENGGENNASDMCLCKINLADVYLNLGNTDSAKILVDEIEPFFRKYNVETAIHYINTIRIGIAIHNGQLGKVREIVDSEHFKNPIEQSMKSIRARYMKRYYRMTGDYKNALLLTEQTKEEEDSMAHNKMNMRAAEIMMRFTNDTLKLHHQIVIDKKNLEVKAAYETIAITILVLISALLAIAYMYINVKKNKLQTHLKFLMLRLENTRQRVSPHFVFNVLNQQIGHNDKERDNILVELSKLIRSNLDLLGKSHITLKEEMEFVSRYISIEKKIIGDSLVFTKDIRCDIDNVKIPSMMLQILVENAIKHGLNPLEGEKRLTIRIEENNELVNVSVEDNGLGFDCRRISPQSTTTGLNVVKQTISIVNRNNKVKMRFNICNLKSEDGKPSGCKATLTIPKEMTFYKY